MKERGANTTLEQSANGGIGVRGRRIVVAPVYQRRDAMVDLVEAKPLDISIEARMLFSESPRETVCRLSYGVFRRRLSSSKALDPSKKLHFAKSDVDGDRGLATFSVIEGVHSALTILAIYHLRRG
jgi:hypothetical protein